MKGTVSLKYEMWSLEFTKKLFDPTDNHTTCNYVCKGKFTAENYHNVISIEIFYP